MNLVEPDAAATSSSHDDDDAYSFSYLYNCSDGEPAVPTAYANGSWGSIAGDWYVIAGTQSRDSVLSGDCCRMRFAEPSDDEMNQWMMYTNDDNATTTDYFWNFTGNVAYKGETGVWMNEGYPAHSVGKIWSSVWGVGTYRGARWFGWYECGESVKVTEAGIPWIVADDKDLASDATFTALAEEKMDALGLLASGAFTTYRQSDDCDYVWHHVKADVGSEEDDTYVRASGASGA